MPLPPAAGFFIIIPLRGEIYRRSAEAVVDLAMRRLATGYSCTRADVVLPTSPPRQQGMLPALLARRATAIPPRGTRSIPVSPVATGAFPTGHLGRYRLLRIGSADASGAG